MDFNSTDDILSRASANRAANPATLATGIAAPATPAAPVAPVEAPAATPGVTPAAPRSVSLLARAGNVLGRGAGMVQAGFAGADMLKNGVSVDNATDMGIGALTLAAPAAGIPLGLAKAGRDYAMQSVVDMASPPDIRGPETMKFLNSPAGVAYQTGKTPAVTPPVAPAAVPTAAVAPPGLPASLSTPIAPHAGQPLQVPQLAQAPQLAQLGAPPKLQAEQGQSIFSALMNLGGQMSEYAGRASGNRHLQTQFENQIKAGQFNISAMKDMANVRLAFNDDERKGFETDLKTRQAEAQRLLADGQYPKEQEAGLKQLAGIKPEEYSHAVVSGEPDPTTGVQPKTTVMYRKSDGKVVPIIVPGFNDGAAKPKPMPADKAKKLKEGNGWNDQQMQAYLKKNNLIVGAT